MQPYFPCTPKEVSASALCRPFATFRRQVRPQVVGRRTRLWHTRKFGERHAASRLPSGPRSTFASQFLGQKRAVGVRTVFGQLTSASRLLRLEDIPAIRRTNNYDSSNGVKSFALRKTSNGRVRFDTLWRARETRVFRNGETVTLCFDRPKIYPYTTNT